MTISVLCHGLHNKKLLVGTLISFGGQSGRVSLWRIFQKRVVHFVETMVLPYHQTKPSGTTITITAKYKLLVTNLRSHLFTYCSVWSLIWSPGELLQQTQNIRLLPTMARDDTTHCGIEKRMQPHILLGCSLQSTSKAFQTKTQPTHGSFPCRVTAG